MAGEERGAHFRNKFLAGVRSWLQRLKDDNRLVVQASAQAQKAADFILGQHADQQEKEDGQ